jgi:predicted alpha/beta-hydrolase family hydrolase
LVTDSSSFSQSSSGAITYYLAARPAGALLVLAHGAGAGQRHPFMVGIARALSARGVDVATFDFPYMQQKRKVPDKTPVLEASYRDVVAAAMEHEPLRGRKLFIGGKSMGGRMATHLASHGVQPLSGVVALGYPLHPPGRPQQLRAEHLPAITTPVLIVQGERDTFGTPAELAPVIRTMRAPVTLHVVEGGDHSLAVRGGAKDATFSGVADVVAQWVSTQLR